MTSCLYLGPQTTTHPQPPEDMLSLSSLVTRQLEHQRAWAGDGAVGILLHLKTWRCWSGAKLQELAVDRKKPRSELTIQTCVPDRAEENCQQDLPLLQRVRE